MPKYVLSYHGGGMAPTEEEQAKVAAARGQWFQGLGDKLVDRGLYICCDRRRAGRAHS